MADVFTTSGENPENVAVPTPQLQGMFVPSIDNSMAIDGLGIVTPWGAGGTARRYSDYGLSAEVSQQSTQLNDLATGFIPGGGAAYNLEGLVGPQGPRGPAGPPGIMGLTSLPSGYVLPVNSNFLADLPHNIDEINNLGTAVDRLVYTSEYTTVAEGPTGDDLCSGTTDGDTLSEYGDWSEREITFDVDIELSYTTSDSTKQGAQATARSWYQSFIPETTITLTGLEINIDSVVDGTAKSNIYFYNADADGKPTGAALGGGLLGSLSSAETGWQGDLTLDEITLTAGNRYCFRLAGKAVSGEYHFDFDSGDSYADGTCWYWDGSDYVAQNGDIDFKIYGTGGDEVELIEGEKYTIVVNAKDVVGEAELYWSTRTDNPYANGDRYASADSGESWTIDEDDDVWFKTKADGVEKDDGSFDADGFNRADDAHGETWIAQTFTAGSTYTFSSIVLKLAKMTTWGGTVETVTVSIKAFESDSYSEATWAEAVFTSAGRALLDDANAAAQATTLGLGTGDSPIFTGAYTGRGSAEAPAYGFTDAPGTGMYMTGGDYGELAFTHSGHRLFNMVVTDWDAGDADVNVSVPLRISDGSAARPSLTHFLDPNTGWYRVGNDQVGITTGGTLRATFANAGLILSGLTASKPVVTNASKTLVSADDLSEWVPWEGGSSDVTLDTLRLSVDQPLHTSDSPIFAGLTINGAVSTATLTVTESADEIDVSEVNVVFINITENIILGGLTGGVDGQVLEAVYKGNYTKTVTFLHKEGVADQDFYMHTEADETFDGGGITFTCDGSNWYDGGHGRHV